MHPILAVIQLVDRQPKPLIILLALASLVPIGLLDSLAGHRLVFGVLYLAPISFITWHVGPRWGVFFSVLCAAMWDVATSSAGATRGQSWILYWDTLTQLAMFGVVTLLLSALRSAHDREVALARTDSLTGVANSRWFREQLDREILRCQRYQHPFTVIYGDLDNFKTVNDHLGHAVGDAVLREAAASMKAGVRTTDIVARLGGDEFAILLPETDHAAGNLVAQELRQRIRDTMQRHAWPVSSSFGMVTCVTPPVNADALLDLADQLMYAAKREGKGGVRDMILAATSAEQAPQALISETEAHRHSGSTAHTPPPMRG
jgi:diguanylate cyclase (GGDEF)-like protein